MTEGFGLEKVPTTEAWCWVVFGACIANFIVCPIFIFVLIRIMQATSSKTKTPFHKRAIFIASIGYLLCLFGMSLSQFFLFQPARWGITPSMDICNYGKRLEIVFIASSRYFFYQFCVFRVYNAFHKSAQLKLRTWQLIFLEIIINGYLLYHAVIFNTIIVMQPHPIFGFCYAIEKNSDIHVAIFIIWDAVTVFCLIYMFSSRLICGMTKDDSNDSLSWFKTKTLILGILATFSSFCITVLFVLGRMNRFLFTLDGFINACCIVFTYNMRYVSIPRPKRWKKQQMEPCNCQSTTDQKDTSGGHQPHEESAEIEPLKLTTDDTTTSGSCDHEAPKEGSSV
eukprot:95335_1